MDPDPLIFSAMPSSAPRPFTEASGFLFHRNSLIAAGGVLLLSAWGGLVTLVVPLGLVLAAALLARLWARLSLLKVSCRRALKETRLFPGDRTELRLEVANRKPLPLPWVEVEDAIPPGLLAENLPPCARRPGCGSLLRSSSLLWYRRTKWRYSLCAGKRGFYSLGPLHLSSGDPFGFYRRRMELPLSEDVIVYPRIFPIPAFSPPSLFPLGDIRSQKRIFQDPVRPIGLRDYQPFDSLRHIHWKASGRSRGLQVKIFEPTVTLQASLFLGVDSYGANGGFQEDDFEWGISLAASLAHHLTARGISTGLFANGRRIDSGQPARILPGGSPDQILLILEALAKLTPQADEPLENLWRREQRSFPQGTTLIFVLHRISSAMAWQLRELKEAGYRMTVLLSGGQDTSGLDRNLIKEWARPSGASIASPAGGAG